MRKKLIEETVLFASILKWFVLASIVGGLVGFSTTIFLKVLMWTTSWHPGFNIQLLLLPVGLFFSSLLIYHLSPESEGHGTEKVLSAIHKQGGNIPLRVIPVKLAATIITLTCGGSVGKEGPCAQIGAGMASAFCDLFRIRPGDRKKMVICGVSAGFASVFGTPIAGALFGVEVLAVGQLSYSVLFPSLVAGVMGYYITHLMGYTYFKHPVPHFQNFTEPMFLVVSLAGVVFGIFSFLFIELIHAIEALSHRIHWWKPGKGLIGGVVLIVIALLFGTRYMGLGLGVIDQALQGQATIPWYDPIIKMIATATTLSFGGSGGIVTTIFYVGATLGNVLSSLLHIDPALLSALGMVALCAGCTNTPIASSVMALEMFGSDIGVYACIACVISFVVTGHRSVYPSQILGIRKSETLAIETGLALEDITVPAEYCRIQTERMHDFEQ